MKIKPWVALPIAGFAATVIGVGAVAATPSPSATGSTTYAQVFVDKLAGILHLTPAQTQAALKQAQLQTVDQMLKDGRITQSQADGLKARINAGDGLGAFRPFGRGLGPLNGNRTLGHDLMEAELDAAASALHLGAADLQSQLKAGKTLSSLEQASRVADSTVKAAMKDAAKTVLDKAVKAGTITQDQENVILSRAGTGFGFWRGLPRAGQTPAAYFQAA